jgi:hypothetical protein
MEVSKRPLLTASSSFAMSSSTNPPECPYRWVSAVLTVRLRQDGE